MIISKDYKKSSNAIYVSLCFFFGLLYNQKGNQGTIRTIMNFAKKKRIKKKNILHTTILIKYLAWPEYQFQTKDKKLHLPSFLTATSEGKQ